MVSIPFHVTDWANVSVVRHPGDSGFATWRSLHHGDLRIRLVEYSAGYLADHWCAKGHIIYCIEGSMNTELADGRTFNLTAGMSYEVSDDLSLHRTSSRDGVRLLIVDGAFLKRDKGLMM